MANQEAKRTILYCVGAGSVAEPPGEQDIRRTLPGWAAPSHATDAETQLAEAASPDLFDEAQAARESGWPHELRGTWTHMLASWQLDGDPEPELAFMVQLRGQRRKTLLMVFALFALCAGLAVALALLWRSSSA